MCLFDILTVYISQAWKGDVSQISDNTFSITNNCYNGRKSSNIYFLNTANQLDIKSILINNLRWNHFNSVEYLIILGCMLVSVLKLVI